MNVGDVNIARRAFRVQFNRCVAIVDVDVPAHVLKVDALASGFEVERSGDGGGTQLIGLHVEVAVQARELKIGSRRGEVNRLGDVRELHVSPVASGQCQSTADVGDIAVVQGAIDGHVAGDFLGVQRAVPQVQR